MQEGEVDDRGLDYVYYQIEWRVKLNNRVVAKDTEQDLALPPRSYWERIKDTAIILRRKIAHNRRMRLDDTILVVSVNERSQSDLIKRFKGASVDWTTVENQPLMWANLYRLGKKLRIQITINYIDDHDRHPSSSDKRGNHLTLRECLRNVTPKWMPSRLLGVMKSGEMCIESCVVLDLHAATKGNIAGRTHTGKSTTEYAQST